MALKSLGERVSLGLELSWIEVIGPLAANGIDRVVSSGGFGEPVDDFTCGSAVSIGSRFGGSLMNCAFRVFPTACGLGGLSFVGVTGTQFDARLFN